MSRTGAPELFTNFAAEVGTDGFDLGNGSLVSRTGAPELFTNFAAEVGADGFDAVVAAPASLIGARWLFVVYEPGSLGRF